MIVIAPRVSIPPIRPRRPFKSPILREYFSRMAWYRADPDYSDDRLTAIDKKNIRIVQSVEESIGGPETDPDFGDLNRCA